MGPHCTGSPALIILSWVRLDLAFCFLTETEIGWFTSTPARPRMERGSGLSPEFIGFLWWVSFSTCRRHNDTIGQGPTGAPHLSQKAASERSGDPHRVQNRCNGPGIAVADPPRRAPNSRCGWWETGDPANRPVEITR